MDKLLKIKDVAEFLSVSETTVYEYIRSGSLKAHRLGKPGKKSRYNRRPWRVWGEDLEQFINSGLNTSAIPKKV